MSLVLVFLAVFLGLFVGVPLVYFLHMGSYSKRKWNLSKKSNYFPSVTVIVPMHNEERVITLKLQNLSKVEYPRDQLRIIIVNDGSTDGSVPAVEEFKKKHSEMNITVLDNTGPRGKTAGLNLALGTTSDEIVVVSDADCFWKPETLVNAVGFLSDPSIGAVTGLEFLLNAQDSWVTETELVYNDLVHKIRIGESKFHSTVIFQGGFGAYKRSLLDSFDLEADDSGTALNIVQKGSRAILVPDVAYFTMFPKSLRGKMTTKLRRAGTLVNIWLRGLRLLLNREVLLPKRILLFESFLHIISPFVFLFLVLAAVLAVLEYPVIFFIFLAGFAVCVLKKGLRTLLIETVQDQFYLGGAIFLVAFKRKFGLWSTELDSRTSLTYEMLERDGLV